MGINDKVVDTTVEKGYASTFRELTLKYLEAIDTSQGNNLIFSPAWYHHVFTMDDIMYEVKINGLSIAQALQQFTSTNPPQAASFVQACEGFDCGEIQEKKAL